MRTNWKAFGRWLRGHGEENRIGYWNRDKAEDLLLISIAGLSQGRRDWLSVFPRKSATALVRATMRLTTLVVGRIRKNARRGGKLERSHQHRQYDCQQNRTPLRHANT